jgi:thiamine-monophosphate kinase
MAAEFDIIARYFAPLAGPAGLGLLDDAALLQLPPGHELVITTDAIVADVHFFNDDPAEAIGHKALAVNLSDLAAKGAEPLGFVMSLILPQYCKEEWIAAYATGLGALAASARCPLIGGDTVFGKGPLSISITAFGAVPTGKMVKRGNASEGDILFVSGTIGDGALGLLQHAAKRTGKAATLSKDHEAFLIECYLRPKPRNAISAIVQRYARAAMDISDGFVGDITKLVHLSGYGANIHLSDVPYSVAARAAFRMDQNLVETALTGGDDYEILAAVPADKAKDFLKACLKEGVVVTRIGHVTGAKQPVHFINKDGKPQQFTSPSYVHGGSRL